MSGNTYDVLFGRRYCKIVQHRNTGDPVLGGAWYVVGGLLDLRIRPDHRKVSKLI